MEETFLCIADAVDASIMSQRILIDAKQLQKPLSGEKSQLSATVASIQKSLLQMELPALFLLQQRRRWRVD